MCFHNRAIDQVQTVARFCRQRVENTLPDSSPRPAVEPIVRARVWAVAFGQIAPWDPRPQHVKYCIHDPPVVRARALPTLRHERLESRPFLIAEIESHDPPPPAVNHDAGCFSVNYAGTDPNTSKTTSQVPASPCSTPRIFPVSSRHRRTRTRYWSFCLTGDSNRGSGMKPPDSRSYPPLAARNSCGVVPVCLRKKRAKWDGSEKARS